MLLKNLSFILSYPSCRQGRAPLQRNNEKRGNLFPILFSVSSNLLRDIYRCLLVPEQKQTNIPNIAVILGFLFFNLRGHFSWSLLWLAAGEFLFDKFFTSLCESFLVSQDI